MYFKKCASTKFMALVLALTVALALTLCACGQKDESSSWKRQFDLHPERFGTSKEGYAEENDLQGAMQELYRICSNQPEVLASTVSAYPELLMSAGLHSETTAEAIDDYMSEDEYGGVLQAQLLKELQKLLEDPRTQARFTERSGKAEMYYMYTVDEEQPSSPANIRLIPIPTTLLEDSYTCLEVTPRDSDSTGIFYLAGGFQRIVP